MRSFTVGPVQEADYVLEIGARQTPYFRNQSFSGVMLENEKMICELAHAPRDARTVFLTASGTGAMEASVMNVLDQDDKALVINGGGFGQRFVQLCAIHKIPYEELRVPFEEDLTAEMLAPFDGCGFTALLVNVDETSIGKLYDMELISAFCKRNHLLLIVDAISTFLADPFDMAAYGVDVMIASSQKALALPPGISFLVLSVHAVEKLEKLKQKSLYFDLCSALKDGERGQTPFTPAVSVLLQLHERLRRIVEAGPETEIARTNMLASYFREQIVRLPFDIPKFKLSNAVTPVLMRGERSAEELFERLERDYGIWVCPNGGEWRRKLFRVGHIGALETEDYERLVGALRCVVS